MTIAGVPNCNKRYGFGDGFGVGRAVCEGAGVSPNGGIVGMGGIVGIGGGVICCRATASRIAAKLITIAPPL
jgi:hypothetical protein